MNNVPRVFVYERIHAEALNIYSAVLTFTLFGKKKHSHISVNFLFGFTGYFGL